MREFRRISQKSRFLSIGPVLDLLLSTVAASRGTAYLRRLPRKCRTDFDVSDSNWLRFLRNDPVGRNVDVRVSVLIFKGRVPEAARVGVNRGGGGGAVAQGERRRLTRLSLCPALSPVRGCVRAVAPAFCKRDRGLPRHRRRSFVSFALAPSVAFLAPQV